MKKRLDIPLDRECWERLQAEAKDAEIITEDTETPETDDQEKPSD